MIRNLSLSFIPQIFLVVGIGTREDFSVYYRDFQMNPVFEYPKLKSFRRYVLRKNGIDYLAYIDEEFNQMDEIEIKKEFKGIYARVLRKGNIQDQFKRVDIHV
ncbi:hypothetical protein [Methanococcus maripaludis]|nr:hypothetical protein [Methanococcus maripaludis]